MHLFFFFLNFGLTGPFRPIQADTADTGRYGRYGPSRPDFGRVGADFSRVGPIRESPRGTTRHGPAVCGVPPTSPRPAASDAGALAWEPRPCIPGEDIKLSQKRITCQFGVPRCQIKLILLIIKPFIFILIRFRIFCLRRLLTPFNFFN